MVEALLRGRGRASGREAKQVALHPDRFGGGVGLAKQIIDSGKLGKIFHYRANFLQDWTINADLPQGGDGLRDDNPSNVHSSKAHRTVLIDVHGSG